MGHYTRFRIGQYEWQYKYSVPHFLIFIFDEDEFFYEEEAEDGEAPWYNFLGYRSSGKAVLEKLDRYGFNDNFFEEIYHEFEEQIELTYHEALEEAAVKERKYKFDEDELENIVAEHIDQIDKLEYSSIGKRSKITEIIIDFLRAGIDPKEYQELLEQMVANGAVFSELDKNPTVGTDGERLIEETWWFAEQNILFLPPTLVKATEFLIQINDDFPDITGLLIARALLPILDPKIRVEVDLSDMIDPLDDAKKMHEWVQQEILTKIDLYNKTFRCLLTEDSTLNQIYLKRRLANRLPELVDISDKNKKGRAFEEFTRELFSISTGFIFSNADLRVGDEEIDLIYKNNSSRPFWMALHSPQLFIECKCWKNKVEAKHLRDFETKLINHHNLCRVGIVVSMNGFTSECNEEIKRSGRDDHILVLISGENIHEYLTSSIDFHEWLENLISSSIK